MVNESELKILSAPMDTVNGYKTFWVSVTHSNGFDVKKKILLIHKYPLQE